MRNISLMALVFGTAACAFSIGFIMQETAPARQMEAVGPLSDLRSIELTSAPQRPNQRTRPTAPDLAGYAADQHCPVTAVAIPAPQANARVTLSAPCQPLARVSVHHNGLMFTETSDAAGTLSLTVPALSDQAVFIFELPNGRGAVARADIPEAAHVQRVALQWDGAAGFEIHALEGGASYGQPGHIWSGGGSSSASVVLRLGDSGQSDPRMVEVYTYLPASDAPGNVALSVETEVSQQNCGRDVSAQALELRDGRPLRARDLTLAMPDCAAVGDFLVLNNLVQDLTIASR